MAFVRDNFDDSSADNGAFKSAFGEDISVPITPITQISAQYGVFDNVLTVTDEGSSGTTSVVDEKFTCQTGSAADGLASILTRRQITYRAGQGALARFTAVFSPGVANSNQGAGLITAENIFSFGFINDNFGIIHAYDGMDELQKLTLTVAGAAETVDVTINGILYQVALTGAGTVEDDAYEIASALNAVVPNYDITSNGAVVSAQAVVSAPQNSFAYTAGTSVGSWSQITAGANPTVDFIPQALWNRDTRINTDPDVNLDPTKGNVYQIQFQYLGFGAIEFFVEDKRAGSFVLVHRIEYANTFSTPSVNNPSFRVGWLARNLGNTTNVTVSGASAGLFVEGLIARDAPPRSAFNDQLSIGATDTNILTLRSRITLGGKVNRAEFFPQLITGSTQASKFAVFKILLNPTFGGNMVFDYIDEDSSVVEVCKDSVPVSGGLEIGTIVITSANSQIIRLNENNVTPIPPGTTLTISAAVPSGSSSDCQVAVSWQEDL